METFIIMDYSRKIPMSDSEYEKQCFPAFRNEWELEYLKRTRRPAAARVGCFIAASWFAYDFSKLCFSCTMATDVAGGTSEWMIWTYVPEAICSFIMILVFISLSVSRYRGFCVRHHDEICFFIMTCIYTTIIYPTLLLEIRRSRFQWKEAPQIHWSTESRGILPSRLCNDSDPPKSWRNHSNGNHNTAIGCNNLVLCGDNIGIYILANFCSMIFGMRLRSALLLTFLTFTILVTALLAIGVTDAIVIFSAILQLCVGISSCYLCQSREISTKQKFLLDKAIQFSSAQNSNLLHTLIPQNVVEKLATRIGDEMVFKEIQNCTVMFCSLKQQNLLQQGFSQNTFVLLDEIFSSFDDLVRDSGMYKYQHVGEWYIVACPRAACPFDEEEQARPYPTGNCISMLKLAEDLQELTRSRFSYDGSPLELKVGMHIGPVAGAVIGSYRSFYCLYGDTMNTAARMCKYAGRNPHCTQEFASAIARSKRRSSCESLGLSEIKGKGLMETYEVQILGGPEEGADTAESVDATAPAAAPAPPASRPLFSSILLDSDCDKMRSGARLLAGLRRIVAAHLLPRLFPQSTGTDSDPAGPMLHRISRMSAAFSDADSERQFRSHFRPEYRFNLTVGLALHTVSVLLQWAQVTRPPYDYDFAAFGAPALEAGKHAARTVLSAHAAASDFAAVALTTAIWFGGRCCGEGAWGPAFVLIKMAHLAASVAAYREYPDTGWLVAFPMQFTLAHGWMGALHMRSALSLTAAVLLAEVVAVLGVRQTVGAGTQVTSAVVFAIGGIWLTHLANLRRRTRWRLQRVYNEELRRLRGLLLDLLPSSAADRMIRETAKPPSEVCRAVVLQLDLCGFTVLSRTLPPASLAAMIHEVFCAFDRVVVERGLFKMDTIGDAYIALGFLRPPALDVSVTSKIDVGAGTKVHPTVIDCRTAKGDNCLDEADQRIIADSGDVNLCVCNDLLHVSRAMILVLRDYRRRTGLALHCRIGVGMGDVVTGILGQLQPRFHVFGEGLQSAEWHEQTGASDAVHADSAFLSALRTILRSHPSHAPQATTKIADLHPNHSDVDETRASGNNLELLSWAPKGWTATAAATIPSERPSGDDEAINNAQNFIQSEPPGSILLYPVAMEGDSQIECVAV